MIRVTVWNEYVHEQEYENIRAVYPEGIFLILSRTVIRHAGSV